MGIMNGKCKLYVIKDTTILESMIEKYNILNIWTPLQ